VSHHRLGAIVAPGGRAIGDPRTDGIRAQLDGDRIAQASPMLQTRSLAGVWSIGLVVHQPCGPSLLRA
jgi:hypothetical protein